MQNMKLEWEYLFDNIGTRKEVALLKDEEGSTVLTVFEDPDCHVTQPDYARFWFIESEKIFFCREKHLVQKQYRKDFPSFTAEQLAEKQLLCACEVIKESFEMQLSSRPIMRS